ncbi:sulfite exporter TauE/SafE family protein [Paenibacillus sp. SYP-B3998]|uniref:Sulfite exporter TauE/SafE family protein n=1 Tax=Paenibacillus sp. SYP-B3998 TaxID=2678564 RepID=A0A6G4A285_9BACL|nr:sulfite exporter TauE/SafE family protein [Paenibacillus sp. SYP-B3998]NEW08606.1 sulfite exporter TauE/SafE family protein [Paenibacillus sp. SYP-B3998]
MYSFLSQLSTFITQPFINAANTEFALFAALFLGFVGSLAPCQISANIAAITYFGNRQAQEQLSWKETFMYLVGKMLVFIILGTLFWIFGQQLANESIYLLAFARKLLGPLLIVVGAFLLGWFSFRLQIGVRLSNLISKQSERVGGTGGAFLLGVAFSLGFCPTMYVLFFGTLMPISLQSSYGVILPPIFAVGTAMPFLLFLGLTIGLNLDRTMIKHAKRWGNHIQKLAGVFLIIFGINDTITYWSI